MGGFGFIFSCPFHVIQPPEKEVVEALPTLPKPSEEAAMNPCVQALPVLGSLF